MGRKDRAEGKGSDDLIGDLYRQRDDRDRPLDLAKAEALGARSGYQHRGDRYGGGGAGRRDDNEADVNWGVRGTRVTSGPRGGGGFNREGGGGFNREGGGGFNREGGGGFNREGGGGFNRGGGGGAFRDSGRGGGDDATFTRATTETFSGREVRRAGQDQSAFRRGGQDEGAFRPQSRGDDNVDFVRGSRIPAQGDNEFGMTRINKKPEASRPVPSRPEPQRPAPQAQQAQQAPQRPSGMRGSRLPAAGDGEFSRKSVRKPEAPAPQAQRVAAVPKENITIQNDPRFDKDVGEKLIKALSEFQTTDEGKTKLKAVLAECDPKARCSAILPNCIAAVVFKKGWVEGPMLKVEGFKVFVSELLDVCLADLKKVKHGEEFLLWALLRFNKAIADGQLCVGTTVMDVVYPVVKEKGLIGNRVFKNMIEMEVDKASPATPTDVTVLNRMGLKLLTKYED